MSEIQTRYLAGDDATDEKEGVLADGVLFRDIEDAVNYAQRNHRSAIFRVTVHIDWQTLDLESGTE